MLEVGFGSGLNVPYYPVAVTDVKAVDPATEGRKLAAGRIAASAVPIEFVGLDGASLPLDDASVDHVLTTMTICTIPDVEQALREIRRVLRPAASCTSSSTALARSEGREVAGPVDAAAEAALRRLPPEPARRPARRRRGARDAADRQLLHEGSEGARVHVRGRRRQARA